MVAKLAIHVCPVSGCVTISTKAGSCPNHPNRALTREVYEHRPKVGAPRPGDLGSRRNPFSSFDFSNTDMSDILSNLFGNAAKGKNNDTT